MCFQILELACGVLLFPHYADSQETRRNLVPRKRRVEENVIINCATLKGREGKVREGKREGKGTEGET